MRGCGHVCSRKGLRPRLVLTLQAVCVRSMNDGECKLTLKVFSLIKRTLLHVFTLLAVGNMKKNDSQRSLVDIWPKVQKIKKEANSSSLGSDSADILEDESLAGSNSDYTEDQTRSELFQSGATARKCMCCNDDQRAYHPNEGTILSLFAKKAVVSCQYITTNFHGSQCVQHKKRCFVCTADMPISINCLRFERKGTKHFLWGVSTI